MAGCTRVVNAVPSSQYHATCPWQDLPGEADSRSNRVLPVAVGSKGIVHAGYSRRESARKIGGDDIAFKTSSWRRAGVGLVDIEARAPSQVVAKLPQSLVAYPKIQGQRPPDPIVVLQKCRAFPHSKLTI